MGRVTIGGHAANMLGGGVDVLFSDARIDNRSLVIESGSLVAYFSCGRIVMRLKNREEAVPMARVIADVLDGDLDIVRVRQLRAPGQGELAIGAMDESGTVLKSEDFHIAAEDVREEIRTPHEILRRRRHLCTGVRPSTDPAGRTTIIGDDSVATRITSRAT